MKVAYDIMTANPICVFAESKISEAAKIMLENHFNGLPVVDKDGNLIGIVTQSDLIRQQKKLDLPSYFILFDSLIPLEPAKSFEEKLKKMHSELIRDIMTEDVRIVHPQDTIEKIASYMAETKHYSLPVVEDGKLIGIVGKEDLLREVAL